MQWILGLDLSTQPCEVSLSRVDGTQVEVVSRRTVALPIMSEASALARDDISSLLPKNEKDKASDDVASSDSSDAVSALNEPLARSIAALREAVDSFEPVWTVSSVVIPPFNFLGLNVNLPFGDPKNVSRIVDLEVQDLVPFELDEFLVQYSTVGPASARDSAVATDGKDGFDVHVGLLPRMLVKNVLAICRSAGLEPFIMTVPSSALGAVYHLGKDYFKGDSALLLSRPDELSLAIFIGGKVRIEHILRPSQLSHQGSGAENGSENKQLFTALRLMIASAERRYGTRIETVYILGRAPKGTSLQQLIGRPVEPISLSDVLKGEIEGAGLSALSTVFAADNSPGPALSNFRAREFSFSPRIGEFLRGIAAAWRYAAAAALAVVVGITALYGAREYELSSTRAALVRHIKAVIPDFDEAAPDIIAALRQSELKLSEELGVLGSPAKVTPLNALLEIIDRVPLDIGASITTIKVTSRSADLKGNAPDLSAIERLQRELKSNKAVFSDIKVKSTSPSGQRYNFELELLLRQ